MPASTWTQTPATAHAGTSSSARIKRCAISDSQFADWFVELQVTASPIAFGS